MSQIEITVLKQGTPSRKVLTCCFFTVGEAYRDFKQYIGNLRRFVIDSEQLTDFEVRIYTDDTGKEYALEIAKGFPRISVLHYDCPAFRDGKGHSGMFGTLVRFLPMFEDLDIAWCSDIDIPRHYLNPVLLKQMSNHKTDIYISTYICYERNLRSSRRNSVVANKFITKVQFPRALLTRFLNMIINGKLNERLTAINQENATKHTPKPLSKVPYGTDELFMNTYIYNWIVSKNIRIMLDRDYFAPWLMFKMLRKEHRILMQKYYYYPSHSTFLEIKKILANAEPEPGVTEAACYKDFVETLPKLKSSSILRFVVKGENLEKI
uniref:Glycosyltransferase n=1 Tax=viral metagenome TaxID=1070528 RepID=A0A6C0F3M5_9ZZZZ